MSVVEVVEVGMEVGHAVDHKTWQLCTSSLNSSLSVVKHTEIRSTEGCLLVLLLNESDLDVLRQVSQLSLDGICHFLHLITSTSFSGVKTKISK